MPPIIGITQCLDTRGRWRKGRDYAYLDHAYARAVERAGGVPVHLPIQHDVETLAGRIDGLLLPGGDDFLPETPYPAETRFDPASEEQIDFDGRLLAAAQRAGLPILGVCYGMQLMALRNGGRLYHHLPIDRPDAASHQLGAEAGRHAMRPVRGTRLAELLGPAAVQVNSRHHQAVADPGPGLIASGHAPDGVIEAIEAANGPFRLGVQWHPEEMDDACGPALFDALVRACGPD